MICWKYEMRQIEIHFKGHLNPKWHKWFGDLTLSQCNQDYMVFSGIIADQAELYGVISHLRDLGLELIFVRSTVIREELQEQ
jgi:hypothetical protein